jgi:carboxylate-amine ligase
MFQNLSFQPSLAPTIGVELELQVLDPETGDLAPGGLRILNACEDEGVEGVSGEFLLSMLEVKTGICNDTNHVRDSLFPQLRRVHNIAASLGYELAMGGTHPFARPCMAAIFPDERYQRIQKRQGWMAYQEAVFGLHIHVGVPSGDAAIGVTNLVVEYIPHLIALAANSPFWEGVDTSYASSRVRMFRPSGSAGLPPHFANWEAFNRYCKVMHEAGILETTKDMYWDIRPQPNYGTVEFRMFDVPGSMATVLGLCALTRCLVMDALSRLQGDPGCGAGSAESFWLANDNRWMATRYGLETRCSRRPGDERNSVAKDVNCLIQRLLPLADSHEESQFLASIDPTQMETGADRQRRLYRQHGTWQPVLDDMKNRWMQEIDETFQADQSPSVALVG